MWDAIVVGGGTAGCILANRLSEDPGRKVLLIEAGRDIRPGEEGVAILDTYPGRAAFDPRNHWPDLKVQTVAAVPGAKAPPVKKYEQARLLGGGSSINGQVANRGTPADYDEWGRLGATGWDWATLLPYFKKVERDQDFSGDLHGSSGRVPIHRIPADLWPPFSIAAREALSELGYRRFEDQNGDFGDGHSPMPLSNSGRHRVSLAMAYLDAETRRRPNLAIMTDTEVLKLSTEGRRVTGVLVSRGGREEMIAGREIVLAAGALHSPGLLMRSGIGSAAELGKLGIEVLTDLPGVGQNLQEHPGISLSAYIRRPSRLRNTTRRHIHVGLRYSSGVAGCEPSDMFMMVASKSAWHPLGPRIGTIISWINKVHSRGTVSLVSPDPHKEITASFNYLADPRDLQRLCDAVHKASQVFATRALADVIELPGASSYSGFAKALGRRTIGNYLITAPMALAIDAVPGIRRRFFRHGVSSGISLPQLLADSGALEAYVRENATGQWHPCGTCKMGRSEDPTAVVDPATGRVHGVEGLRVVDASVMPTAPRANLNLPVMMVAERMSDLIRRSTP